MPANDYLAKILGDWVLGLNLGSIILRIALSIVLAAVIGWERSSKRHAAGLRTFILVSLASTLAMLLDQFLASDGTLHLYLISAASILAIAIICVNSILFNSRNQIKGLTTSAGL
ncbi:MAG: MgtC/SapB family protein, partial [Clostridiales bacterium]|nr:MgtC/SapB family protein [Candidatus Coliplasma caballi]